MNIKSILAVTDFSTAAEHGLERAALIAARHQAKLRIIYGSERPNLGLADPEARLRQRGRQLARRHAIAVNVISNTPHMLDDIVRHARSAHLLVLDHRSQRALSTFWRGSTLDQVLRRCQCPTLIVKQEPRGHYKRVLVAVDYTVESEQLVQFASRLDVDFELELFHSFEALNNAGFCDKSKPDEAPSPNTWAGDQDDPHQAFARSDLVIVGKRKRPLLIDIALGDVATQLINLARSDVLVYPHNYQAPSAAVATERIQTLLNRQRPV